MPKYAAFLRGVNLASHRRVSSTQLREMYEAMGFENVGTFRSSGNVVFEGPRSPLPKLTARVEKGMAEALGWDVQVFLRTADEVRAIAAHQPFDPRLVGASNGKLQVSLCVEKPSAQAREQVLALATEEDPLVFGERELYWLPSGGLLESELDLKTIEKLIGPTTRRTKGTMELLAEKFFPD
jgi:uncharacterized protein (DUF1697 family)